MSFEAHRAAPALARIAHDGQKDKAGRPYTEHLRRVSERTDSESVVAWLHDIIEDTHVTLDDLNALGFDYATVIKPVDILTRIKGEVYEDYIQRIVDSDNECAMIVKQADLFDHLRDTSVIPTSLQERYRKALVALEMGLMFRKPGERRGGRN